MRVIKQFDPWKSPLCPCPPKYTINPYTGCGFKCIYCYITSYIKDPFNPRPKKDVINNLIKDLKRFEGRKVVAISYSTDPYTYPESKLGITRKILEILAEHGFSILIATKSPLVVRDIDILSRVKSVVSITITTLGDSLSRRIEPEAPLPSSRLEAIRRLRAKDIKVSVRIDPILPYITDDREMIYRLIKKLSELKVNHIVSSVYKLKPDSYNRIIKVFPELRDKYLWLYHKLGTYLYGYLYAPYVYRYNILSYIKKISNRYGMTFSTCREGLRHLDDPETYCDASHLL